MGQRINWSVDGTIAYKWWSTTKSLLETSWMIAFDSAPGPPFYGPNKGLYMEHTHVMFNFPSEVLLDKVSLAFQNIIYDIYVSNDSTDSYNGTWTKVYESTEYLNLNVMKDIEFPPIACQWVRIHNSTSLSAAYNKIHLFGEYSSPRYEFWNLSETQELTNNYSLLLENAPNHSDYSDYEPFKIKNTDVNPHSYAITISAIRYGGDSVITNYFTISEDNGATKVTTINITDLQPGAFTPELRVYADIPSGNNPADGYHHFAIKVVETS